MLTALLLFSAIICYIVLLATYKSQAKYKNGMLFAVTLPADVMDHADIQSVQARFNHLFSKASIWMGIGLVPFLLLYAWIPYQVLYFFVWLSVFMLVMLMPFRRAFRDTLALKREHEWFVGNKRVILSDLRVAHLKNKRSASLWLYLIPFAMAIGLLLWAIRDEDQLWGLTTGGLVLTILFFFISLYMRKNKAKVYSMNTDVNLVLNQARRRALSYLWLFMAIAENIHFLLTQMFFINENAGLDILWITVVVLFSAIPIGSIYYVYHKIHALEQEVLAQDGKVIYTDDDEYWANGFTYHNPHDKSIFVPKRVGMGETVNTATGVGKLIVWGTIGITAAVIIGVSFMIIRSEMTSPTLAVTPDHRVDIKYPMYSYDFGIDDIRELSLVDHVPSGAKTNGEATGQYSRGHFRLKEVGKARLYIFKNNPPYIRIKLDNGYIFYNEKDPLKTKQIFEQLQKQLGE
ncbi:DUF5808 domain-containing protein [Paenibacillus dokdonensis]|uniref:DUF5808 domain-containing protein n=1 Tax=Paenibacillus dokdonensis TaxID=2567944 RepID=A0ABU6GND1_9BACL|nr:DUF5808 domain-containing protein [Paenibacillus dokdonensis]MEC0241230.1 DUF5808 domain-containing protein [Paenibacillus dokdonensis]